MRDFQDNHAAHADKTLIKRLLKYLKPYRGKFIGAFFMMFVTIFTNLVLPLATGWSIDYMTKTDVTNDQKMLALAVATLIGLVILMISVVVGFFQQRILQEIGQDVTHVMRKEVFEHIENLSIGQINLLPVGKLVTRATNDPGNISDMFTNTIVNLLRNVLMMIVIAVVLLVLNWQMALLTFLTLPLILLASSIFRKYSRTAYRNVRTNISELNGYLSENLSGMKITQIFNQEEKKVQNFKLLNDKLMKSYYREINTFGIYRPIIWMISMIATILTVYFGVTTVIDGALSVGLFISFYIYVGQFFEPIQQISEQFNALQNGFSSAEKIFDVLDTKPDIIDDVDAIELKKFDGQIEFKNVWFSYIEGEWILKDVSFKVNPNETVAFVGATGSGKTTILQLIVRNYDIQKGQILIDGIDIKTIKRSSLRKFVGQMLQDVFLFSGTIRDNITLGDPDITDEDIKRASNYVGLDYILNKLPEGLDHVVKERGNNFSSGERQLISFARAVVYNPSLMILDEATANIDSETETIIQESLNKMMNISTMLIVAHRLSTIQHSDRIIVMSKGEIVESGKHQELLKQNGLYYNLYQLQYDKKEGETHV
ncbi:ABC transporter ATP-binding protein [Acholeplasma laidlawii]|jgi:ATP-binding cassette subfamily B protein|uniref:ABC-type transport system, permease and ATPase components n=2 Tax=Acholeplasma laidlawii TaxID=2148 RepID=A9NGX3_ACHLI|nr:ABC transporter ATP-binding protein [Acholeplasma laidlawii]ABX81603.1 ABC-type transport system, permease and ATPase components [Acholeplasma laidlawii PG-8A]NWH09823.1 ABC transporter ATP-binding protein [Acholeplasma laidlawii]NWH11213.1 ABC transporter ATP-binding protein [Acholeplasma laidlawii]NWH13377.1 ABC transporter ATP-binding protein [Acholeplasma laidlawii]NWH14075.1 ABC transporter ATP-binding protein [Acholeplasma laidlawii]